jgi:hypothetical protein
MLSCLLLGEWPTPLLPPVQIEAQQRHEALPDITQPAYQATVPWLPSPPEPTGPSAALLVGRLQRFLAVLTPDAAVAIAARSRSSLSPQPLQMAASPSPLAYTMPHCPPTMLSATLASATSRPASASSVRDSASGTMSSRRILLGAIETAPRGEVFSRAAIAPSVFPGATVPAVLAASALETAAALRALVLAVAKDSPFKALGLSALMPVLTAPAKAASGKGGKKKGNSGGGKASDKAPILAPLLFTPAQEAQRSAFRSQQSAAAAVSGLLAPPDMHKDHLRTRLLLNVDAAQLISGSRPELPDLTAGGDAAGKKKAAPKKGGKDGAKKGGKKKKKKAAADEADVDPAGAREAAQPLLPASLLPPSLRSTALTAALPAIAASPTADDDEEAPDASPSPSDDGSPAAEGAEPAAVDGCPPPELTAEEAALLSGAVRAPKPSKKDAALPKYPPIPPGLQPLGHRTLATGHRVRWDVHGR